MWSSTVSSKFQRAPTMLDFPGLNAQKWASKSERAQIFFDMRPSRSNLVHILICFGAVQKTHPLDSRTWDLQKSRIR
jgi:hypothetical protein